MRNFDKKKQGGKQGGQWAKNQGAQYLNKMNP